MSKANIVMRALALAALAASLMSWSAKAGTATNVHVEYTIDAIRLRPSPTQGSTTVNFEFVLHDDGTVNERSTTAGKFEASSQATDRKLGPQNTGVVFRVLSSNSFLREGEATNHVLRIVVTVDGNKCKADVDYKLKPGRTEYYSYSTELGAMAYYSELKARDVRCTIQ